MSIRPAPVLSTATSSTAARPAGLLRRLGAILYDTLLLLGLWMIAGALMLPLSGGEAIPTDHPLHLVQQLVLLLVAFAFFAGFWIRGGQTLGMRTWRLRLVCADGGRLDLRRAALRFASALLSWGCLGLGFLWALRDPRRRTWHDLISGTALLYEPKPAAKSAGP